MHYQVGDQTFKNKFQAARHAIQSKHDLHFNMYESVFDKCDWTTEPTMSWNQLLDLRANQIAAKGKPIVLYFSGGTDSYTIYKVFERNNIHIDLIYMRRRIVSSDLDQAMHKQAIELLEQHRLNDPATKIVVRDDNESIFAEAYGNQDWMTIDNTRWEFGMGFNADTLSHNFVTRYFDHDDFISVVGHEKPRVIFDYHGIYSHLKDVHFCKSMNVPGIDFFYVSPDLPELHIKQSYMLAKYIRSLRPKSKPLDIKELSINIDNPTKFDWNEYSTACGRFGDLSSSGQVHLAWAQMALNNPIKQLNTVEHTGIASDWFASLKETKIFKNYIDGIISVQTDAVGKFLLLDYNNLYSVKPYFSKMYRLNNSIITDTLKNVI